MSNKRATIEPPVLVEQMVPCPKCKASVGQSCRNYKGGNKPACKARKIAAGTLEPPPPPPVQQEMFPPLTEAGQER